MTARRRIALLGLLAITVMLAMAIASLAFARDLDGRYAASPLHDWFEALSSAKGRCCSDADGSALSDVDWLSLNGKYQVRIDGRWYNVPDDAVITEPNLAKRTMVWPVYLNGLVIQIRCFMPGPMT